MRTTYLALISPWKEKDSRAWKVSKNTLIVNFGIFSLLSGVVATELLRTRFFMMAIIKTIKRKGREEHCTLKSYGARR